METISENFDKHIPSFSNFINENYPAGAANDSNAPWNQPTTSDWNITGVSYDVENGDIVFSIDGDGYPSEVKVWSGDNVIINIVDPTLELDEDEFDSKLQALVTDMAADEKNIPEKLRELITSDLTEKHDKNWQQDAAQSSREDME